MRITLKCVTESRRNPNHLDKIQKETRPIAKPILITNYEKKMNTFGTNLFRIELYFTLANFLKHPTISVLTTVLLQTKVTILNAELVSTQIFFFTLGRITKQQLEFVTSPAQVPPREICFNWRRRDPCYYNLERDDFHFSKKSWHPNPHFCAP